MSVNCSVFLLCHAGHQPVCRVIGSASRRLVMAHVRRRAGARPQRGDPGHGRGPRHVASPVRRRRRRRGRGRLPEEHRVAAAAAAAVVGRAAAARHGYRMEARRAGPEGAVLRLLQLDLEVRRRAPGGSRGLLERPMVVVVQVVVVLVGEGAHGARLRADCRVVPGAAPPATLLPGGLSPAVYGFSDPPRDQRRLVLGPHLCCRTSTVFLVRCFHLF